MSDNKLWTSDPAGSVKTLAEMMRSDDAEVQRTGRRQLWEMVRHIGRPGNSAQQQAVVTALLQLIAGDQPVAVKREAVWAVSELGDSGCVDPLAGLLANADLRQDACMALERLPGDKAVSALKAALGAAPQDFKIVVAHSLRARGVAVDGLPCAKLKPTKKTEVKPVGRA